MGVEPWEWDLSPYETDRVELPGPYVCVDKARSWQSVT